MGASEVEPVPSFPLSPRFQRQRSLASAISSRCCSSLCIGRNSISNYELDDIFPQFSSSRETGGCLQRRRHKQASSWQESTSRLLGSRRLRGSRRGPVFCNGGGETCPEADEADDDIYYKPSPWKIFLRKLRSETKKMNCARPSTSGFHYDAFSYAMNFDDGGWQPPQQSLRSFSEFSSMKLSSGVR